MAPRKSERIERDSLMDRAAASPDPDESVLAIFRADRGTYWRQNLILAAALGLVAGLVLLWQGNAWPVAGPAGALLAIGARAGFLASEVLGDTWTLTARRLLGPAGRILPLSSLAAARPFLGAVQLVTASGDKHLIRYLADPAGAAARIDAARGTASGGQG